MSNDEELKIIMVATRGIGKTSLLAAMHEEFDNTFERANLQAWTDDNNSLKAILKCKDVLRNIDPRLKATVTPTDPRENPWSDQGFIFELGSSGRKFMKVKFTDPSGEYFNSDAKVQQKDYVKRQLNECDAVVIPIDATAMMQKKTGKVTRTEMGTWHEEINDPKRITQLLKDAYSNITIKTSPRLLILAPLKCETYMRTSRDAEDLLNHVKMGYSDLIDFLKSSENLINNVAVVITPVQTIGNVTVAYPYSDQNGFTKFAYHKTPINAPYEPKDGDQPIRYILRFLINVYLEKKKEIIQKEKEVLKNIELKLSTEKDKLESVKKEFSEKQRLLNERNKTWWLFRSIANIFDDRETPYYSAKNQVDVASTVVHETQTNFQTSLRKIQATQQEIDAFNNAIFSFAIGCKNSDGFAILQGYKWLAIPQQVI